VTDGSRKGTKRSKRVPDPDRWGGRPPIESIEIRSKTYVTATVQPLDVTGVRTTAVGTLLWVVTLVVLLIFRSTLEEHDREWWLWTCGAGIALGLLGLEYCRRRIQRLKKAPDREVETSPFGAAGL